MKNTLNSKTSEGSKRNMTKTIEKLPTKLEELQTDVFYRVEVLQSILKKMGLNYSIFTIRDYETYKCLNYKCGKRYVEPTTICANCGSEVREPLIVSPRTSTRGRGAGHRRYSKEDIQNIINLFKQRD